MHNKDTVLIVYPPGGFGFFLNWCLEYFSGNFSKAAKFPFLENLQQDLDLSSINAPDALFLITSDTGMHDCCSVSDYINNNIEYQFGRTNAVFDYGKKHKFYIQNNQEFFKKFVCLVQDQSCCLMVKHNLLKRFNRMQDFVENTVSRNKDAFGAQLPVPQWQLREMISFEHQAMVEQHNELYQPISHRQVINVSITDLVNDFQSTMINLFADLDLTMAHQDQLGRIEAEWLADKKFTKIDQLCHDIVSAVLNGHNLSWQQHQLTLIDEAYIQYLLRQNRLELRCYGLDTFPTSSVQLKELLYPV
jgi:hypothetical protein